MLVRYFADDGFILTISAPEGTHVIDQEHLGLLDEGGLPYTDLVVLPGQGEDGGDEDIPIEFFHLAAIAGRWGLRLLAIERMVPWHEWD